eukprot:1946285-Rhodomonas_salina.2
MGVARLETAGLEKWRMCVGARAMCCDSTACTRRAASDALACSVLLDHACDRGHGMACGHVTRVLRGHVRGAVSGHRAAARRVLAH